MSLEYHAGDCAIYSTLNNGRPYDGICNCGYGLQQMRKGDYSELMSEEVRGRLQEISDKLGDTC